EAPGKHTECILVGRRLDRPGGLCYLLFACWTHSAMIFQSGSSLERNCRPPLWKRSPPASAASGCKRNGLEAGVPGTTRFDTVSKLRRDCSTVHVAAPGESGCKLKGLRLPM